MSRTQIFHNDRLRETYVVGLSSEIERLYGFASELPYTLLTLAEGGDYISSDGFTSMKGASMRAYKRSLDQNEMNCRTIWDTPETDGQFFDSIEELNFD